MVAGRNNSRSDRRRNQRQAMKRKGDLNRASTHVMRSKIGAGTKPNKED